MNLPHKFIPAIIVLVAFVCAFQSLAPLPQDKQATSQTPSEEKNLTEKGFHFSIHQTSDPSSAKPLSPGRSQPENAQSAHVGHSKLTKAVAGKLDELNLPDICTADLPGLDFENHQQALNKISQAIRQQSAPPSKSLTNKPLANATDQSRVDFRNLAPPPRNQSFVPVGLTQQTDAPKDSQAPKGSKASTAKTQDLKALNPETLNPEIQELRRLLIEPLPTALESSNASLANYNPHANAAANHSAAYLEAAANPNIDPHAAVFSRTAFPSATECKACHEQIYREWSVSGHAYAAISPMFHKFEQRINDLSQGTIGYFCMRCHAPVATTMELRRDQPIWDGPKVFKEGVTCVACHRVVQAHGKDNGERRMEPGPVEAPIVASGDGIGVELAKKHSDFFKVKTDRQNKKPGQLIHRRVIKFDQLSKSTFCVSCHQVAVEPGIALEVVWNQYRASPAYRQGITCQDCHMGRVPGMAEGYSVGPVAIIDGKQVSPDRKHSNHQFYGPGYSIAHPGIFPHNPDADKWTFNEWLQFDWRAGWGTEKFEQALQNGQAYGYFPPVWAEPDDRMDAREIIDANLKLLAYKRDLRRQVMENGAKIEGPYFAKDPQVGDALKFHYVVRNISTGHNMPSGSLGAQPQLWLNVVLIGPRGNRLWESGYLDSVGDLADHHSADVLSGKVPLDSQLFNLQTKFLTTNVKGTDREMYLPINVDIDQLPFIRPDPRPNTVMNHPPFIRMEAHSIAATGSRNAKYKIPAHLIQEPGCYRLSVRMRSRAEPIYFMKFVNATPEMIRSMNEGILDVHTFSKTFIVR